MKVGIKQGEILVGWVKFTCIRASNGVSLPGWVAWTLLGARLSWNGSRMLRQQPHNRARRASASPKRSSFTPIRSMRDKYKLHNLRLSSPAYK